MGRSSELARHGVARGLGNIGAADPTSLVLEPRAAGRSARRAGTPVKRPLGRAARHLDTDAAPPTYRSYATYSTLSLCVCSASRVDLACIEGEPAHE